MLGPVYALMQITSNILASAVVYTAIKVWNITSGQLKRNQNNPELYDTSGVIDYGTKKSKISSPLLSLSYPILTQILIGVYKFARI
jgi:hypothetical protein